MHMATEENILLFFAPHVLRIVENTGMNIN